MVVTHLQVLNGNPYNRKCDVYSFGICLWEIYCCDMPYPDLSFSEITSAVVRQVCSSPKVQQLVGSQLIILKFAELAARDTTLLPELSGTCDENLLGCKP